MSDTTGWTPISDDDLTSVLSGHVPSGRGDLLELSVPVECVRSGFTRTMPEPTDELQALLSGAPVGVRSPWRGRVAAVAASTVVVTAGLGVLGALPAAAQSVFDRISGSIPLVHGDSAEPPADRGSGDGGSDAGSGSPVDARTDEEETRSEADPRPGRAEPTSSGKHHDDADDLEDSDERAEDSDEPDDSDSEVDSRSHDEDREDSADSESEGIDEPSTDDDEPSDAEPEADDAGTAESGQAESGTAESEDPEE